MANLCGFSMIIKGKSNNLQRFIDAMSQNGDIWMGRGADVEIVDRDVLDIVNDLERWELSGWCKWSVQSSLVDDAFSMEKQRTEGKGCWNWNGNISNVSEFISLWEASSRFNVDFELFSEEPGMGFQEHMYAINDGVIDETNDYSEYYLGEFDTIDDAINEFDIEFTEEEFKSKLAKRGGFEWNFEI